MASESAKQYVAHELRTLRREFGVLSAAKLSSARMIVVGLGGGNEEDALTRLLAIAEEHHDIQVESAMASFGHGVSGAAVLERLDEFAARHFVDARTVRRWSDAGIRKLTYLIVGSSPWLQPRARLIFWSKDGQTFLRVVDAAPPGVWMHEPELWLGDERVPLEIEAFTSAPEKQTRRSRNYRVVEEGPDLQSLRFKLKWSGKKPAQFETLVKPPLYFQIRSWVSFRELIVYLVRPGNSPDLPMSDQSLLELE